MAKDLKKYKISRYIKLLNRKKAKLQEEKKKKRYD
jgi:hypothetical protein